MSPSGEDSDRFGRTAGNNCTGKTTIDPALQVCLVTEMADEALQFPSVTERFWTRITLADAYSVNEGGKTQDIVQAHGCSDVFAI